MSACNAACALGGALQQPCAAVMCCVIGDISFLYAQLHNTPGCVRLLHGSAITCAGHHSLRGHCQRPPDAGVVPTCC